MNTSPVLPFLSSRVRWAALLLAMLMLVAGLSVLGVAPDAASPEMALNFTKITY